ncbi:MAG: HAMP domain-containing sensor histidine kinase [Pirellulales bacterium]
MLRGEADPERRRQLAEITAQAHRAHEMIVDLMLFAKPPALKRETVDLAAWLPRTLAPRVESAHDAGIVWSCNVPALPCPASIDPTQTLAALGAVLANSFEALAGRGGAIDCELTFDDVFARIRIRDDGPGMDEATRERIFDPFYSGREAGRGLGFGLCKAWRIVHDHGGEILVRSSPGQGCETTLIFPRT